MDLTTPARGILQEHQASDTGDQTGNMMGIPEDGSQPGGDLFIPLFNDAFKKEFSQGKAT